MPHTYRLVEMISGRCIVIPHIREEYHESDDKGTQYNINLIFYRNISYFVVELMVTEPVQMNHMMLSNLETEDSSCFSLEAIRV